MENEFDRRTLLAIHDHLASPFLDDVMQVLTRGGGTRFVYMAVVLLALIAVLRRRTPDAIVIVVAVITAKALNLGLKFAFDRERPDLWDHLVRESTPSFPSGHSAGAAAVACAAVLIARDTRWRIPVLVGGIIYTALIGFTRLYLGVHYPTDVLVGWCVGAGWVALMWRLTGRMRSDRSPRTRERS